ncbi:MAG: hypothetical protein ACRDZM_00265 [Acidimicrobiia bacterium]
MNVAQIAHRRWFERFLAILSAFAMFTSLMVMFAPAALAHHPEISAGQICADGVPRITYESVSWKTDGTSGSGHPDIRIEVRVNGSGSWIEVGNGVYNAANDFRFSGSFDATPYFGDSIELRARTVGAWDNGTAGGQTTATSAFVVDLICTRSVTVTANPQVCAVDQQGVAQGAVTFDIAPASGATVQVYTNASFTDPVGGGLGDDVALSLSPGTYYWQATAARGYTVGNPDSGQFTIAPCTASAVVVAGACAINANGAPVGMVQVTIDPDSGATVAVTGTGGPYNFSGVGGSVELAPGSYSWQATAGPGFTLGGQASGTFDIDPCEGEVSVSSGVCTVGNGPLGTVEVGIDPDSSAIVSVYSDSGMTNLVATFTGDGGTAGLAPGTYHWSAAAGTGFALTGDTTGSFTIAPCTTSVTVVSGECVINANGAPLGAARVVIDPDSGATVVISGPGGPYNFSGNGGSQELAPGSYTWVATPGSGFSLTGDGSGSFTIDPCQAAVAVTGACVLDGNVGSGLVTVEISAPGSMTVEVFDGTTLVGSLISSGSLVVPEGKTYTWKATPSSGIAITGADHGTVDIPACSRALEISVSGVCEDDVPLLRWSVTPVNFTATQTTITWLDIDSGDPLYSSVQPLSGEMAWPGAVVGNGKAVDWPGWVYVDKDTKQPVPLGTDGGTWVKGDDGYEETRPSTTLQFDVNPVVLVEVDYPGGEPTCDGPPDEVLGEVIENDGPDLEVLPFTGIDAESLLAASLVLLGSGWILVRSTRRREEG